MNETHEPLLRDYLADTIPIPGIIQSAARSIDGMQMSDSSSQAIQLAQALDKHGQELMASWYLIISNLYWWRIEEREKTNWFETTRRGSTSTDTGIC